MKIGFIGAGKVGFSMGKYLVVNGYQVSGYYSKNPESARQAAEFTNTEFYETADELIRDSEVVFLTVPDGRIREVFKCIPEQVATGRIFCHCSGALSSAVFSDVAFCYGYSIHPFFAVNDKLESYKELSKALITIEGPDYHRETLADIFRTCGNKVVFIDREDKVKYHAAAVMASNLSLGLIETAVSELTTCGFDRDEALEAVVPLALNNLVHLQTEGLEGSLTGPIERNDITTVEKHLKALDSDTKNIYTALSGKTLDIAKRKYPKRDYTEMEDLLNG